MLEVVAISGHRNVNASRICRVQMPASQPKRHNIVIAHRGLCGLAIALATQPKRHRLAETQHNPVSCWMVFGQPQLISRGNKHIRCRMTRQCARRAHNNGAATGIGKVHHGYGPHTHE